MPSTILGGAGCGDFYTLHPKMDEVWQYAHREGRGGGDEAWVFDTDAAIEELRAFLEKGPC